MKRNPRKVKLFGQIEATFFFLYTMATKRVAAWSHDKERNSPFQ